MKKLLIVCMSCQDDFFVEQEKVIKETWAGPIIKGEYPGVDFLIYKGDETLEKHKLIKSQNTLLLRCEDDLDHTFKKTYYALSLIDKNFEYDYIFRTNTSTFVNVPLMYELIHNLDNDEVAWFSELYSLSEAYTPYPLCLFGRGNGMLLSRKLVKRILVEGINFVYYGRCDDWVIGNILNSYWFKQGKDYTEYIKSYKHGWFKCISTNAENNHTLCPYYNDNTNFNFLKQFVTIQIKRYNERDLENANYYELWNVFSQHKDTDLQDEVDSNLIYSTDSNVFIGSILGYIPLTKWKSTDKGKLYALEINNKAYDDAEFFKRKKPIF